MGQATVDLPDPLDTPAPTTSAGTDDLLSQLAGEEIDRLLADADSGAAAASESAETATVAAASIAPPASSQDNDAPPDSSATAVSPRPAQKDSDPELAAALDNLLDGLDEKLAATPVTEGAAAAESPTFNAPDELPVSAPPADELGTSSSEREGLTPQEARAHADGMTDDIAAIDADDSLPPYLKPLEWLSAPLANASESMRDAIGKIAILTLVNAFAILIYVLFIRRH